MCVYPTGDAVFVILDNGETHATYATAIGGSCKVFVDAVGVDPAQSVYEKFVVNPSLIQVNRQTDGFNRLPARRAQAVATSHTP